MLTVLLENNRLDVILDCAEAWSNGCHAITGCTLGYLLEWLWDVLSLYKTTSACISKFYYFFFL
jgi:hypothetical protein